MRMRRMRPSGLRRSTACRLSCVMGCAYTALTTRPSEPGRGCGPGCAALACLRMCTAPAVLCPLKPCSVARLMVTLKLCPNLLLQPALHSCPHPACPSAETTRLTCGHCGCTPAATAAWTAAGASLLSCRSGRTRSGCRSCLPSDGAAGRQRQCARSNRAGCTTLPNVILNSDCWCNATQPRVVSREGRCSVEAGTGAPASQQGFGRQPRWPLPHWRPAGFLERSGVPHSS